MLLSILVPGKFDEHSEVFKRLTLNLKQTISNIERSGYNDVELVLCDWGSETKITEKLGLSTSSHFRCVYADPATAQKYNKEAKYSIVHPINTAFRNSKGRYVIFWDSDCFVPYETFVSLYNFVSDIAKKETPETKSFYWGSRRHIPFEIHSNTSDIQNIEYYLYTTSIMSLRHDKISIENFLGGPISLLMDRSLWEDSTGWWEELTYWGWQDIEFHRRLQTKYNFGGDLEDNGMNFFHLEHPLNVLGSVFVNPQMNAPEFKANGANWGLNNEVLEIY